MAMSLQCAQPMLGRRAQAPGPQRSRGAPPLRPRPRSSARYQRETAAEPAGPPPAAAAQQAQQPHAQQQPQATTYHAEPDVFDGDVKIIGLGQRGISATARLMGNKSMQGAEFWVLDADAKVLGSSGAPNTIHVPVEDDAQLPATELRRLAGPAAVASASAAGQRPGSPVATCGVAFLLAGAGGIPGGSTLLLQVAAYLRRTGFFVVAALTRPFEFEGRRKLEEADALIEALDDVAQLVVVVPQGVLTRASAELTINEASAIADNTLEVSCRAVLWALGAPEVLRASAGTMLWHGRDLRQYKRLLSPPLEVLLTCPGVGGLGRGLASLPVTALAEAGLASGLSTLAEDAVAAAVESPFLESALPSASAVLCVLSLPARVTSHDFDMAPGALNDPEKYAIRAAVQVAAMTVADLAGRHCQEVVVCAHVRPDWPHTDPSLLCLEATLLVLEDPAAAEEAASAAPASAQAYPFMTPPPAAQPTAAQRASSVIPGAGQGAALRQQQQQRAQVAPQQPPQQQQQQQRSGQQVPAAQPAAAGSGTKAAASSRSAWAAMSAIAGGSAGAAVGQYQQAPRPSPLGGGATGSAASAAGRPSQHGSSGGGGSSSKQLLVNFFGGGAAPSSGSSSSAGGAAGHGGSPFGGAWGGRAGGQQQQQQQQDGVTLVPRMAEKHVDTMVAQSLDLPPSAARWRHQQRRASQTQQRRASHFPLAVVPWNSSSDANGGPGQQGGATDAGVEDGLLHEQQGLDPPRDVRSRVAGMLQNERGGGWESDEERPLGG